VADVIRIHEHGDPSVLQIEIADVSRPGPGEVRLRQEAVGINFVDGLVRRGLYPQPAPTIPGFEAAGVVTEVGSDVTNFTPGDKVAYFFAEGAYASERLVSYQTLLRLPADISTEVAATFIAKGLTAWMGIRILHQLRVGETALILGASGGVGSILSRWSRALGATVIGVAGSPAKLSKVRAGATHALHAGDPDLVEKVRAVAPDGVDVVYDLIGSTTFDLATTAIRDGGTIAAIGAASGHPAVDQQELSRRGINIRSGGMPSLVKGPLVSIATAELWAALRQGVFADLQTIRYPLAEAAHAHRDMEGRQFDGLPILVP